MEIDTTPAGGTSTDTLYVNYATGNRTFDVTHENKGTCLSTHFEEDIRGVPVSFPVSERQVSWNGNTYELKNIHYHAKGEHKQDNQPDYPAVEAHLLHQGPGGAHDLLVLVVLLDVNNSPSPTNSAHDDLLVTPPNECDPAINRNVNLRGLIPTQPASPAQAGSWRYVGSKTTPETHGGSDYWYPVQFVIFKQRQTITPTTLTMLRSRWSGPQFNAKPLTAATPTFSETP
ncbi:carbonic anhydrase family protein [Sinosporangium siamense]|uniref:carbonic anhydrase family protein n=1 Tax=Sinosporangium siamense TaxID=1367973 RepID=UPI00194F15B9|nr:carbonic anhydrase family protein [Sinosporangium siamense]